MKVHHRCTNEHFEVSEDALPLLMGRLCDGALLAVLLERLDLAHGDESGAEQPSSFLYQRAARALRRARRDVPAYRDTPSFERLPMITSAQVMARWSSYNRGGLSLKQMARKPGLILRGSSGTTSRSAQAVALEKAVRFERADAENIVFGRVVPPRIVVLNRPGNLFDVPIGFDQVRVHRETADQLRVTPGMNPTTTQPAAWEQTYEAIAAFAPESIQADANYLVGLGLFMRRRNLSLPTVRELILGYNFAWSFQRKLLGDLFGARLVDMYHSGECSAIGISCPIEEVHLLESHILYEIVRERRHARTGELGVLVLSLLDTRVRPLLRYALGDVVRLVGARCPCGRPGRVISVEGRVRYLFEDGRGRITTTRDVDRALASAQGVAFAQVRRTDAGLTLSLVRGEHASATPDAEICAAFEEAFALSTRVQWVDALPLASPNGKIALMDVPDHRTRFYRQLLFGQARAPRKTSWSLGRSTE
ncbi:Phenylacetate-coenzyme A ligase [Minicystis rosea]|nr:Phenylacetate-coenzyme A ligase [Minicystis rosea]